jgi:hypothetical protein
VPEEDYSLSKSLNDYILIFFSDLRNPFIAEHDGSSTTWRQR